MQALIEAVVDIIRVSAAARRISVRRLRAEIHCARVQQRQAMARRRAVRHTVAHTIRRTLHQHRATVIASVRQVLLPPARTAAEPEPLQAQVLRVIRAHPEGVRALDVGNELGVDWRGVLEMTRALVDAGAVEEVDHQFYPAKASRT
jgi:hypothetical protein